MGAKSLARYLGHMEASKLNEQGRNLLMLVCFCTCNSRESR